MLMSEAVLAVSSIGGENKVSTELWICTVLHACNGAANGLVHRH